jgi:PTS system nitrogen regulatory IIA component
LVIQVLTKKKETSLVLSNYLDKNLIVFLEDKGQDYAISHMVDLLDVNGKLIDKKAFHSAIIEREKIVSTGIGVGVAIPHAKLSSDLLGSTGFFIAVGIQKNKGMSWNSLDGSLVRLIFMVGGPDNKQTEYLKILSSLTQAVKDETRRQRLLKCTSADEVIALFSGC